MRRKLIALLFLMVLVCGAQTARATLDDSIYTDTDKVAFAFLKLGHFTPDYADMVKSSAAYDKADPVDKIELLRNDITRLDAGYQQYDLDQDLVHVMAEVKVMYAGKKGAAAKQLQIVFPNKDVSFPFSIGSLWVDVVPDGLTSVMPLTLSNDDYDNITHILNGDGINPMPAIIEIRLRPLGLDNKHPGTSPDHPVWPMLAAVKEITVWDRNRQHIAWSYDAPGYQSGDTKKLNDLYVK